MSTMRGDMPDLPDPAILFVDDDADLRELVCEVFASIGLSRCMPASSLAEVEAHATDALACSLAIVDINLGSGAPSGLDVYRWLQRALFRGRTVFLTGHGADDPQVMEASQLGSVEILSKPIGIERLATLAFGAARAP
jgi:FixJ family two-component response regulator